MCHEQNSLEDLHYLFDKIFSDTAFERLEDWYNFVEQIIKDLDYNFDAVYKALDILYEIGQFVVESRQLWCKKKMSGDEKK